MNNRDKERKIVNILYCLSVSHSIIIDGIKALYTAVSRG